MTKPKKQKPVAHPSRVFCERACPELAQGVGTLTFGVSRHTHGSQNDLDAVW